MRTKIHLFYTTLDLCPVSYTHLYSDGKPSVFAKYIGVAPSTISSWLSRDTLDYDLIFAKCENISSDWLLTGKGEMIKSNPNIQILNEPKTKEKKLTEQEVLLYDVSAAANLKTLFDNKMCIRDR